MFARRTGLAQIIVTACLVFLGVRLFGWQVSTGPNLKTMARAQRVVRLDLEGSRGRILDRHGRELHASQPAWALVVFPGGVHDAQAFAREVAPITGQCEDEVLSAIEANTSPFVLATGLDPDKVAPLSKGTTTGALAVPLSRRYGEASVARHLVGYINPCDGTGVTGLEAVYDEHLRGRGATAIALEVDANLGLIPGLGYSLESPECDTHDLLLTIDGEVQRVVEAVMDRRVAKGAVVVLDPLTGEVLAMASRPQYDQTNVRTHLGDEGAPFVNRALRPFPPGSVFKVVIAAAALEEGLGSSLWHCDGQVEVDGLTFGCYLRNEGGHGTLDLGQALAQSCNVAFIQMASQMGPAVLLGFASELELGAPRLGVTGEGVSSLPPLEDLGPRGLANFAIGQGSLLVTPLDMAMVMASVANNGVWIRPWLVRGVRSPDGKVVFQDETPYQKRVMSDNTAMVLRKALEDATVQGTGRWAFVEGYGSSGKTGTAETGRRDEQGRHIAHAWFVGYAPAREPRYVVAVLVEDGMSGPTVAAPVFREIVEGLFTMKGLKRLVMGHDEGADWEPWNNLAFEGFHTVCLV